MIGGAARSVQATWRTQICMLDTRAQRRGLTALRALLLRSLATRDPARPRPTLASSGAPRSSRRLAALQVPTNTALLCIRSAPATAARTSILGVMISSVLQKPHNAVGAVFSTTQKAFVLARTFHYLAIMWLMLAPLCAADDGPERLPPLPEEEPGRAEMQYQATCINAWLGGDAELLHVLPLQPSRAQLASACRDGILMWCGLLLPACHRPPVSTCCPPACLKGCLMGSLFQPSAALFSELLRREWRRWLLVRGGLMTL